MIDEKPHTARATALLAANGYALIQTMMFVDAHPALPGWAAAFVLIPAGGMACAYGMLEAPNGDWEEWVSGLCVIAMLLAWIWCQVNF